MTPISPSADQSSASATSWIWLNFKIGAFSIGVASRLLLFEEAIVRHYKWISPDEFQELLTLAQMLPGPNLVNFSACAGSRLVPRWAALIAVFALILPGACLAISVYAYAPLDNPNVKIWFQGMAIGAFMLTARFIWQLIKGLSAVAPGKSTSRISQRVKSIGRAAIAGAVTVACLQGTSVVPLIAIAAFFCLVWEFIG